MSNQLSQRQIFEKLRLWRNDLAKRKKIEPFMIFPNDTLKKTAEDLPEKIEDLYGIKGWGATKISRYGKKVLEIINNEEKQEARKEVVSVRNFLGLINRKLAEMQEVKVQGEITESSTRERYAFFTLKDTDMEEYVVNCFAGWDIFEDVKDLIEEGFEVVVSGFPRVYKNGRLSLQVENIEAIGEGALKRAFEALKKKLQAKGLFDQDRKKQIPEFIKKIGLITSGKSAAIRDFRKNLGEHGFQVFLKDVSVEGDRAVDEITSAIKQFNRERPDMDVLVLVRGGGSLESLKAFNSEKLANTIAESSLPVITGVGHERDVSIADFVADKSLSTPTSVANFLDKNHKALIDGLEISVLNLIQGMKVFFKARYKNQEKISYNLFQVFAHFLDKYRFSVSTLNQSLFNGFRDIFDKYKNIEKVFIKSFNIFEKRLTITNHKLSSLLNKLLISFQDVDKEFKKRLALSANSLKDLSPLEVLKRGYSITYKNNNPIKNIKEIKKGDKIKTKLYKGEINSEVK